MFYKQPKRIFGPPVFGNPIQRGEGFGNFFSSIAKLAKKVLPNVSKVAKKVLSSDIVKEGSKKLLDHGMDFATNLASDVISGEDISESAQRGLQEARQKIAQTIRDTRKSKPPLKRNLTPLKAKSPAKKSRGRKTKKYKNQYSVFDDEAAK